MHPKLSIITVNLNNAEGLEKTIKSVISQTFTDYEYIIIDGGSIDVSREIIEIYSDKITYWVSEPDKGIYNGMNKGIKVAKGEYCLFLNSGDWLEEKEILKKFLAINNKEDFIYGNIKTLERGIIKYSQKLTFYFFFNNTICHQAIFIKRILFNKFGLYDESLTILADWEFFLKTIVLSNCTYKYINKTLSVYESNGISSKEENRKTILKERESVLRKYFPLMYDDYKELEFYKNSGLVQEAKKLKTSNFYKRTYNFYKRIRRIL